MSLTAADQKRILLTGATGKVGQTFIRAFLKDPDCKGSSIRALCHNRAIESMPRVEMVRGDMANRADVEKALDGMTHVVHMATCKEIPELVMDVTVKGLFWLLEGARSSPTFEQFILIGGDAAMGHFVYPYPNSESITEDLKHRPYPGCYALSKVLEEVMLEQYYIQYDLNGCCLRAPWIMEKDDFKCSLSFGPDLFGGPAWSSMVKAGDVEQLIKEKTVPLALDQGGAPLERNFVHVDDLVSAILTSINHPNARQQLFNINMDEPVNYRKVCAYLQETRHLPHIEMPTPYHSVWLNNGKAKRELGWKPDIDYKKLIDRAWTYQRPESEPRKVWYPG